LVHFTLQQEYGLRVIDTKISSGYPTTHDITQRIELLQRTSGHGSTPTIIGVGSRPAMDLTKAIQTTLIENNHANSVPRTILIPSTYGGIVASGSSHSLILDSTEETLVPIPSSSTSSSSNTTTTTTTTNGIVGVIAPMETKYMEPLDETKYNINLYACTAIVLDAVYRKSTNPILGSLIDTLIQELSDQNQPSSSTSSKLLSITKLLYDSGSVLSYGLMNDDRSIPIALASSLIPRLFPEMHPLSFFASLVPGLCHVVQKQKQSTTTTRGNSNNNSKQINLLISILREEKRRTMPLQLPTLIVQDESLKGFSIPDMALSHIRSNQAVWNCYDVPDDTLLEVITATS
jgi:hypothetical protein